MALRVRASETRVDIMALRVRVQGRRVCTLDVSVCPLGVLLCTHEAGVCALRLGTCGYGVGTCSFRTGICTFRVGMCPFCILFWVVAQFAENSPAIDGWGKKFGEGASPAGTIEALPTKDALSSLRDFPCSGIGFPALTRWAISGETEPLSSFARSGSERTGSRSERAR